MTSADRKHSTKEDRLCYIKRGKTTQDVSSLYEHLSISARMSLFKLTACLTLFNTAAFAQYQLVEDYVSDGNFFSRFNFFTGTDPTNGFVQYVDQGTAQSEGLIRSSGSNVYIGTDHTNVQPNGRPSVRIQSTATYNSGLFILDLANMPGGICGTWPACKCIIMMSSQHLTLNSLDSRAKLAL